jgi:hypothetical protein
MLDIEALNPRRSTMPESPDDERLRQLRPELYLMLEREVEESPEYCGVLQNTTVKHVREQDTYYAD